MINIDPTVLYFLALRSIQSSLNSCGIIVIYGESSVEVVASVVVVVVVSETVVVVVSETVVVVVSETVVVVVHTMFII